jgi:hypothetical protein
MHMSDSGVEMGAMPPVTVEGRLPITPLSRSFT